jgi:radical SAM protein with 4Fe4S-binding SPASM domain
MRNLMVDPQLQVFPCVALDLSPGAITTFPPQKQFMERLRRMVRSFLEKVDYERCRGCELRSWKLCTGGCLAYYSPTKVGDFLSEGGENGGEYPSHELL